MLNFLIYNDELIRDTITVVAAVAVVAVEDNNPGRPFAGQDTDDNLRFKNGN